MNPHDLKNNLAERFSFVSCRLTVILFIAGVLAAAGMALILAVIFALIEVTELPPKNAGQSDALTVRSSKSQVGDHIVEMSQSDVLSNGEEDEVLAPVPPNSSSLSNELSAQEGLSSDLLIQRPNVGRDVVSTVLVLGGILTCLLLAVLRWRGRCQLQRDRAGADREEDTDSTSDDTLNRYPIRYGGNESPSSSVTLGSTPSGPCPPDPVQQARQLTAGAWRLWPYRDLSVPSGPWAPGLAMHTGPVRQRNEDYALTFKVDDTTVGILGDGCGGIPYGQQAAYFGVMGAAISVLRQLAWVPKALAEPDLEAIALQAIYEAAEAMSDQARRQGIDASRSMRSTLIVVLVTPQRLSYAHLGDGGGWVLHSDDGCIEAFVDPQKAGSQLNLLAASLGTTIQGEPRCGQLERRRGDLVWICSDGIADRTDPKLLGRELAQAAIVHGGDMTAVAEAFLEQFASWQDEAGLVFDDNMSLILMGDEAIPAMAGFARTRSEAKTAHGDPDPELLPAI